MSIRKDVDYPGRWDAATTEYPMGKPKNRTTSTSKDGSYLEKKWIQDYEAFFGALLNEAGFTPNGTVDTAESSQFFDAMIQSFVNMKEVSAIGSDDVFLRPEQSSLSSLGDDGVTFPDATSRDYPESTKWTGTFGAGTGGITSLTNTTSGGYEWASGNLRIESQVDSSFSPSASDLTVYVKKNDGTSLWLTESDSGVSIVKSSTSITAEIDSTYSGIKECGIQSDRGVFAYKSSDQVEYSVRGGFLVVENVNGYAKVSKDGSTSQSISRTLTNGSTYTLPAEVKSILAGSASIVGSHVGAGTVDASFLVTPRFLSESTFTLNIYRVDTGAPVTSATINIQVESK